MGLCDQVFTRVGASDNLARGQSTFMVEMTETANILHNATRRSLVLMDEIGRGTSTYDGVSIAWSVAEDLHDRVGCRCLFATHYHELVELAGSRRRVRNLTIAAREWGERIVFLRKLQEGGASRSYGIQVARLAGLPRHVIDRAGEVLQNLEADADAPVGSPRSSRPRRRTREDTNQLSLFAPPPDPLRLALKEVDLNTTTPLEALNLLAALKEQAERS